MHEPITPSPEAGEVICPRCQQPTDSLKCYDIPVVVCLILYVVWNSETVIACPSCMRAAVIKRAFVATFLSNIMAPFLWVWHFVLIFCSGIQGHSNRQLALAHEPQATLRGDVPPIGTPPPGLATPSRRQKVFLAVFLGICAIGLGLALFWPREPRPEPPREDSPYGQLDRWLISRAALPTAKKITDPAFKVALWMAMLKDPDEEKRVKAARWLGELGPEAATAVPALVELAKGDNPRVREAALEGLRKIDSEAAEQFVLPPPTEDASSKRR
jgi:hypothetical protein